MVDIPDSRNIMQIEESSFRAAVSESLLYRMGGVSNFLAHRNHQEKNWFFNGKYNIVASPQIGVDGLTFFEFNAEIVDVFMYVQLAGSSGTTEIDLKYSTVPGGGVGSFTSLFSVTPKIQSAAGDYIWISVGTSEPNTTAPVLTGAASTITPNTALRADILSTQAGSVSGAGLVVLYRPR